jgi:hypothetical protein
MRIIRSPNAFRPAAFRLILATCPSATSNSTTSCPISTSGSLRFRNHVRLSGSEPFAVPWMA